MATDIKKLAAKCLATLMHDRKTLLRLDEYVRGEQDDPYMPDNADDEYKLLAQRAVTNVVKHAVQTPTQALYVDQFRRGSTSTSLGKAGMGSRQPGNDALAAVQPEWDHWQRSRLDARQAAIYEGACKFGHAFTVTEVDPKDDTKQITRGMSALKTIALFDDPANDDEPVVALEVTKWPVKTDETNSDGTAKFKPGEATVWDESRRYNITFVSPEAGDPKNISLLSPNGKRHGAKECPVTRFAAAVDLEGRTCGIVEPLIPLQNRINQTVFDMLVVQSFASFKVRTISGMAPPLKMKPIDIDGNEVKDPQEDDPRIVDWVPRTGANGRAIPEAVNVNAKRVFWAEDHETRFGTLDETPLDGFIEAIRLCFQQFAALAQIPPHHLLGTMANLSADALIAAETALVRKTEEFKHSFGESWERVFRIAAQIGGWDQGAEDYSGEVIWRDMENRSLAQAGDSLGKLAKQLGIPVRGLWARVPGVTSNELEHWEALDSETNVDRSIVNGRTQASQVTSNRPPYNPNPSRPAPPSQATAA